MLVFVNLLWAFQFPAYKLASDSIGVAALSVWTFAIAALVLAIPFWRERKARAAPPPRRAAMPLVLMAALGLVPPSVVMAWGIEHSSASNAAIFSLTIPALMVVMGIVFLRERPKPMFLVSLVLALLGTAIISWRDLVGGSFSGTGFAGNIAIFASCAGAAFYNAFGKRVLETYTELEVLVFGYVIAVVMCAAISLVTETVPFYAVGAWSLKAWGGLAVLGLFSWGLAMVIWMGLLNRLQVGQISVSVYMLPVLGVVASAILLGERLNWWQLAGGAVVLASAYVSSGASDEAASAHVAPIELTPQAPL